MSKCKNTQYVPGCYDDGTNKIGVLLKLTDDNDGAISEIVDLNHVRVAGANPSNTIIGACQVDEAAPTNIDYENGHPVCYDVPKPLLLRTLGSPGIIGGDAASGFLFGNSALDGGVINVNIDNVDGSSAAWSGAQSAGAFTTLQDGIVTIRFSEPVGLESLRVRTNRNSPGVTTLTDFSTDVVSTSPISGNATGSYDLQTNGDVVITTPADDILFGIMTFDGSIVDEISFRYNQPTGAFLHINYVQIQPTPEVRKAIPFYQDNVLIEHRDSITQAIVPDDDVYECVNSTSVTGSVKIDESCKKQLADKINECSVNLYEYDVLIDSTTTTIRFYGRQCEGSDDIINIETGLVQPGARVPTQVVDVVLESGGSETLQAGDTFNFPANALSISIAPNELDASYDFVGGSYNTLGSVIPMNIGQGNSLNLNNSDAGTVTAIGGVVLVSWEV